ncbi:MAG: mechanosensitive ion channel, partial [Fulvivirga sp.]|nr:mechanosensitive ion channel [Fulvivirga sp.]
MFKEIQSASEIVLEKLQGWLKDAVNMLPNLVIAIVVLILFYFISRIFRKLLKKLLHRITSNASVIKLILSISSVVIMLVGMMVALGVLKLQKTVTSLLAGVGVVGLALGFAFQDAAANLIAGVSMAVKSPLNVGDIVETNGVFGKVKKIGLRATIIYDPAGQDVIVPNRLIFQNVYRHYTTSNRMRITLGCGISYAEDLKKVKEITIEAIEKVSSRLDDTDVEFFYQEFGDSSINFIVRY